MDTKNEDQLDLNNNKSESSRISLVELIKDNEINHDVKNVEEIVEFPRNNIADIKIVSRGLKKGFRLKDLGTKLKSKRDPLPMKLRALPRSFWQQPNEPASFSPAPLPPNASNDMVIQRNEDVVQGESDGSCSPVPPYMTSSLSPEDDTMVQTVVSNANTDLLFSLFNAIGSEKKFINRRGRPKKVQSNSLTSSRDEDPCLLSSDLLTTLTPGKPQQPDTPKTLNYSQLLNDLVFHL